MLNRDDLIATVTEILTAQNGADMSQEFESAAAASSHLHSNCESMTEIADIHLNGANIEVAFFENDSDICSTAIIVYSNENAIFENRQGGDVVAVYCFPDGDAQTALGALLPALLSADC